MWFSLLRHNYFQTKNLRIKQQVFIPTYPTYPAYNEKTREPEHILPFKMWGKTKAQSSH